MLGPDPATLQFNRLIERELGRLPAWHTLSPSELRETLDAGVMGPPVERVEAGRDLTIKGPGGPIPLRVFEPETVIGAVLHIHGGGFVTGSEAAQDPVLWGRAQEANVAIVSVGYRLAPEHPWPAANEDCEVAARWLLEQGEERFGTDRFAIAGESAGAHLSVTTLLRLRSANLLERIRGAALTYGVYDLRGTPSSLAWGDRPLLLTTPLTQWYADQYAPAGVDRTQPDVSPLFADLTGLPPALFSVGTEDPLLDDTLFMAARWKAAGNRTDLKVYPGAPHSFDTLPIPVGRVGANAITHFLAQCMGE